MNGVQHPPESPRPPLLPWQRVIRTITIAAFIWMIRGYQRFISPLFPPRCRFHPSCSSYALTALQWHGLVKGGWLAIRRISRCHPLSEGGEDPVPGTGCSHAEH